MIIAALKSEDAPAQIYVLLDKTWRSVKEKYTPQ